MVRVREPHTQRVPGWPDPQVRCLTLVRALRLVRYYGDRVPTVRELIRDFDIDRATAYRWRGAFVDSMDQEGEA